MDYLFYPRNVYSSAMKWISIFMNLDDIDINRSFIPSNIGLILEIFFTSLNYICNFLNMKLAKGSCYLWNYSTDLKILNEFWCSILNRFYPIYDITTLLYCTCIFHSNEIFCSRNDIRILKQI